MRTVSTMKLLLRVLYLVLLSAVTYGQNGRAADVDPCLPAEHQVINDPVRSTGFDLRTTDTPKCDDKLKRGWYQFQDLNGAPTAMPTTCAGINRCGTVTPFWMNGPLPAVKDGIVNVKLCAQLRDDPAASCCEATDNIVMKNCGNFYVYNLFPTQSCPSGYCAGNIIRCTVDQRSPTGFEPCQDRFPVLKDLPVLTGPIVSTDQTFEFRCEVKYVPNDAGQRFEITWTFNGNPDPNIQPTILADTQREAILSAEQMKGHLNKDIGCQVRTYYIDNQDDKSPIRTANTIFLGVKEQPELIGPTVENNNKAFDFQCKVNFNSGDTDQQIEVVWLFDGVPDPTIAPRVLTGQDRIATLEGSALGNQANKNVQCQARLIFANGIQTDFRKSDSFFFGIKVNPGNLDINVGDTEKELTVTSTIPVVCDEGQDCCVTYKLRSSNNFVVTLKDTCELKICSKDWDPDKNQAVVKITVVPFRNDVSSGNKQTTLSFDSITLTGSGPYIDILKNLKPNPVPITVRLQEGFQCSITGDPHVLGFDYPHHYHFYDVGEYTAYEVKDRDFEVQIKTWRCWLVTCVCGVIVRERNNIIRVNGCDIPGYAFTASVGIPYKLSEGTVVLRSADARQIGILLPSGSEIRIDMAEWHMNVYIKSPAFDINKARGLCGTNDGNRDNDFTHRDGRITAPCPLPGFCIPTAFMDSWRVAGTDNVFVTIPAQKPDLATKKYCACDTSSAGTADTCSSTQHHKNAAFVCSGCPQITAQVPITIWGQMAQARIGAVSSSKQWSDETNIVYVDIIQDERNFAEIKNTRIKRMSEDTFWNDQFLSSYESALNTIPNKRQTRAESITEDSDHKMCNNSIQTSQLYHQCQGMDNMFDNAMSDCIEDIRVGGTTEMLDAVISSFTANCQIMMGKDLKNYDENEDGSVSLMPEYMEDVCPIECRKHGECGLKAICLCHAGWEGNTCHIETGKGPQINLTTSHSTCHADNKICDSVDLMVTNINIFDKLQCQVFTLDAPNGNNNKPNLKPALNEASPITICGLPQTGVSSQNFTVSVTKDGTLFSNELRVQTYDSVCLSCSDSGCVEKKTACHINRVCYKHNQLKPNDASLMCDVTKDTTTWSRNPNNSGIITPTPISWIMILATSLILVTSVSN